MKKLIIAIFFIVLINPACYTSDVLEFNIVGKISSTTCNIKTPNQTVNLGSWQAKSTSGIGSGVNSKSNMVLYTLDFDCPKGLMINAQLEGNRYSTSNIYWIAPDKSDESAKGVAIEMHFYRNGWNSVVYGDTRTLITSTVDGVNSVQLRSFYLQTSATITPGLANSSVTLSITYQ